MGNAYSNTGIGWRYSHAVLENRIWTPTAERREQFVDWMGCGYDHSQIHHRSHVGASRDCLGPWFQLAKGLASFSFPPLSHIPFLLLFYICLDRLHRVSFVLSFPLSRCISHTRHFVAVWFRARPDDFLLLALLLQVGGTHDLSSWSRFIMLARRALEGDYVNLRFQIRNELGSTLVEV